LVIPPSSGTGGRASGPNRPSSSSTIPARSAIGTNLPLKAQFYTFTTMSAPTMTLEKLTERVERGEIDTVVLALCDMQGRLQGKRLTAHHFLADVASHGAEGCNYLLATDST
jgi:hypothetical protein